MNQTSPTNPPGMQQYSRMSEIARLLRRVKLGANNYYWIAGLSVINSLIAIFGNDTRFVIGLAITQVIDALASIMSEGTTGNLRASILTLGFILDMVIAGMFVLFGIFASRGKRWAFWTGVVLYAVDTLLLLAVMDIFGIAFHIYLLWGVVSGLVALHKLDKIYKAESPLDFPTDIGP